MSATTTSQARRVWRRQFGHLYLAALIVTLVPHTAAWVVPRYVEANALTSNTAAAADALVHGRLDQAVASADRALALDPTAERAMAIKASALIEQYWEAKNETDLRSARVLGARLSHSRDQAALVARGNLALVDRDAKQAVALLTQAVDLDPEAAYAQHQLGFALNEAKRPTDALIRLKRALELAPDMAWVQANLANVLAALQTCDEPMPGLIPAARAECHSRVGVARYNANRFADARRAFERAVQLMPETGLYHANYAIARLQTGDRAGALEHATRARALGVKDHPVFAPLGMQ